MEFQALFWFTPWMTCTNLFNHNSKMKRMNNNKEIKIDFLIDKKSWLAKKKFRAMHPREIDNNWVHSHILIWPVWMCKNMNNLIFYLFLGLTFVNLSLSKDRDGKRCKFHFIVQYKLLKNWVHIMCFYQFDFCSTK